MNNHNNNLNISNNNNRGLHRSSRNLDWVKSKWMSIKSNLHEASIQLHTASSAGQCDPYVSVRLVPQQGWMTVFLLLLLLPAMYKDWLKGGPQVA